MLVPPALLSEYATCRRLHAMLACENVGCQLLDMRFVVMNAKSMCCLQALPCLITRQYADNSTSCWQMLHAILSGRGISGRQLSCTAS